MTSQPVIVDYLHPGVKHDMNHVSAENVNKRPRFDKVEAGVKDTRPMTLEHLLLR
jgi:hypothetical protein